MPIDEIPVDTRGPMLVVVITDEMLPAYEWLEGVCQTKGQKFRIRGPELAPYRLSLPALVTAVGPKAGKVAVDLAKDLTTGEVVVTVRGDLYVTFFAEKKYPH